MIETTLPHLQAVVADMVKLQRATGARPDEICRMRPADVDRTAAVWRYRLDEHKTAHHGRERVVLIGPRGQDILRPYLLRDPAAYCFVPSESEAKRRAAASERRVTPIDYGNRPGTNRKRKPRRPAGERYTRDSYRRAIHRACDKVNEAMAEEAKADGRELADGVRLFSRWSPNRLRHSAATELRSRFGIEAAQLALGHSDPRTTLIYAERDLAKASEFIAAVG